MQTVPLKATARSDHGKGPARRLRAHARVPTVAYGKGFDTLSLSVVHDELHAILCSDRGRNSIIDLQIEGRDGLPVMVKQVAVHPVSRKLLHADFVTVDPSQPIEVDVPFQTVGKSVGEQAGGTLFVSLRMLRVRCLPGLIPAMIEHDVSDMDLEQVLKVKDLQLPEGVEARVGGERKVATILPPRVIEEQPAEAAEQPAEGAAEGEEPAAAPEQGEES
jgi:large subunit ribosomal protein L25